MKFRFKTILFLFLILSGLSGLGILFWWESILATLLTSTLASHYDLVLKYEDIHFALSGSRIGLHKPSLWDARPAESAVLAYADSVKVDVDKSKALRGKVDILNFQAVHPILDFRRSGDGRLNAIQIAQRVIPKKNPDARIVPPNISQSPLPDATAAGNILPASLTSPATPELSPRSVAPASPEWNSSSLPREIKYPKINLNDAVFNYHVESDKADSIQSIRVARLEFNPQMNQLSLHQSHAYRQGMENIPYLVVQKVELDHLLSSDKKPLGINAEGIQWEGKEIEKDQYDFTTGIQVWRQVIQELGEAFSNKPKPLVQTAAVVGSIILRDITVVILPMDGKEQSPGALRVKAEQVFYNDQSDELILTAVHLSEAGEPAVFVQRFVFAGIRQETTGNDAVTIEHVRVDMREAATGGFNLNQAVQRIQSVIRSLTPKSEKTAQALPVPLSLPQQVTITDATLALHQDQEEIRRITLGDFAFQANSRSLNFHQLEFGSPEDPTPQISIPILEATAEVNSDYTHWDQVRFLNPQLRTQIAAKSCDVIAVATGWFSVSKRLLHPGEPENAEVPLKPILLHDLQIVDANVELVDARRKYKIHHLFTPLNLRWYEAVIGSSTAAMSNIHLLARVRSPSLGEFSYRGAAAASINPVNLLGSLKIQVDELSAYETYYQDFLPVGIQTAGFVFSDQISVRNNQMDCTFDLILKTPTFLVAKGSLPVDIDNRAVVTALNGLKDRQGDIYFRNNRLEGNLQDPNFDFGTGIAEIMGRNLWNHLTGIPAFALNVVKKTFRTVGDTVGKIIGAKKD